MSAAHAPQPLGADSARPTGAERLTRLIHRANSAGRRLRRLLAEHVAQWNLADTEFLVLWLCETQAEQGLGQGDLAAAIGVSPAQMSSLVERLRKRELVAVRRFGSDRRRQVWQIAPPGRQLLEEVRVGLESIARRLEERVTADEQVAAEHLFERLALLAAEEAGLRLFDPQAPAKQVAVVNPAAPSCLSEGAVHD